MLSAIGNAWRDPSPTVARGYLLTAAALWSLGGLLIKEIDTSALAIVFFRCLFSTILLAPFFFRGGRRMPTLGDSSVSIVLFLLLLVLFVAATKETTAANAIFLQYTAPIYVVIAAPFILGERIRSSDIAPMAICMLGILVLFVGNWSEGDVLGLWLGAGSGLFFGLFFVWLRRMRYADPVAITAVSCAGVALLLCFMPFVAEFDTEAIVLLVVMAAVQFAAPYVLFTHGISRVEGTEASLIALIEPVLNPIWVALFYAEYPSTATLIGGAVIIGGLSLRYLIFRPPRSEMLIEATAETAGAVGARAALEAPPIMSET